MAMLLFSISACGNSISNRTLRKILAQNGYHEEMIKSTTVEHVWDLKDNVKGLEKTDNKLVLVKRGNTYAFSCINTQSKKLTDIALEFTPLNVVQQEIWKSNKKTNISECDIVKKYIEKYGINCFEDQNNAEEFLREITGSNGVIPKDRAQNIISNSITKIFPDIKNNSDVTIFFEDNSAVPMYYATEATQTVYNWSSMPEYVYKIWITNADRQQIATMEYMNGGPAYVTQNVIAVVDHEGKQAGTYDSFDNMKKALLNKN